MAAPLDGADDAESLRLELAPEVVSGAALASGEAEPAVCGAVPLDAPGVGVRLSPGPGVPAEPPPTEVPCPARS
ncbi:MULTISPECIES: hypothetical protein [unclassified Streptomyces]|uniref:hypothetical protein n=1 Tax=unclassified Streptomyces TaxID=2593676 RepID=UPI0022580575|nr:hypothetical protein [Streptomyces sp. NBC_00183]MCX5286313.1 hypothetical protein [Streptomyces sp. NBC_00183]